MRLLDFGIGKLLEADAPTAGNETQFGGRLFTPDYASPEQVRGETVTASTDVFSLGVVLYQLLCSQLPFPRGSRESDSDRHARAAPRTLRGDLDTIVQKALKESVPRSDIPRWPRSPQDLERYLRGEPVLARPDSAWYRLRKFASRNQRLLRAVGVAVAVTVAIGIGFVVHLSREHSASTARALELSADAIVGAVVPRTTPTRDVTAYREYLQARSLMLRPTEENLREIRAPRRKRHHARSAVRARLLIARRASTCCSWTSASRAPTRSASARPRPGARSRSIPIFPARTRRSAASPRTVANG